MAAAQALPFQVDLCAAPPAGETPARHDAIYGFALLGDLHFDKWDHHDLDWVKAEKGKDLRQIKGYVQSTEEHMPRLFERVKRKIQAAESNIAAVVHVGDFVEGLCGSKALQDKQFDDAMKFVDGNQLSVPFWLTKGNHDITGPGARESFDSTLLPWMMKQAKSERGNANYAVAHDKDLFIFFDAYQPDLAWLRSQNVAARAARHVFFVIHPPVVPYNARSNWHVFSKDREKEQRAQLLEWLGSHQAIVLSGHLHRYSRLTRQTPSGAFTQFAINSVVRHEKEAARKQRSGVSAYDASLLELEPKFSPGSRDEREKLLLAEKPHINAFEYARVPGYAMVWVYAERVQADVYLGYDSKIWNQRRVDSALPA